MGTLAETILECLKKDRCTRVQFTAQISRLQKTAEVRINRNGQDFWSGMENKGLLKGHTDSYPSVDLLKAGIYSGGVVRFDDVFEGDFLRAANDKLSDLLRDLVVCVRPRAATDREILRLIAFGGYIPMAFHFPFGKPEWLMGNDGLRMGGYWRAFIDPLSAERQRIDVAIKLDYSRKRTRKLRQDIASAQKELIHLRRDGRRAELLLHKLRFA